MSAKCTLVDLGEALAVVSGLDNVTVMNRLRPAQRQGLINIAGRGRGAAAMTIRDAANGIIAVYGSTLSKDAADYVPEFRSLTNPKLETFGSALEALASAPPLIPVVVTLDQSGSYACIEFVGRWIHEYGSIPDPRLGDLRRTSTFTGRTLDAVYKAIGRTAPLFSKDLLSA